MKWILATDDSAKSEKLKELNLEGVEVLIASDAYALIEEIERAKTHQLIWIDFSLPGMSALQVCQQVQRHSMRGRSLVVGIVSGKIEKVHDDFLRAGGDHLVFWSEDPEILKTRSQSFFRSLQRHLNEVKKVKVDADRYLSLEQIAEGAGGSVFRGIDRKLEREVALKFLKSDFDGNLLEYDQALQEAKLLAQFKHPNLVTVYDVGESEEGAYIVMEVVEGESLHSMLSAGPLRFSLFRQLVEQSLQGIASAHSHGILHLDLKPSNMMFGFVSSTGAEMNLKILDFGIARVRSKRETNSVISDENVVGSLPYMAPERFQSEKSVDRRADLYSLGHIYYEALMGVHAYPVSTPQEMMQAHLQTMPQPIWESKPELGPEIDPWIQRLIAKDPQERFSSAFEALQAFLKLNLS